MAKLSAELLVDRLVPSDLRVSPDGTLVAFVVAPVGRATERTQSAIWIAPTDGSSPARQLSAGAAEDSMPRWAPDSQTLYLRSDRDQEKRAQLYRLSLAGGEAERLTDGKAGIAELAVVGETVVAILSPDPPTEEDERREQDRDDARVLGEDRRPQRLRLVDVETREVRTLSATGDAHVVQVSVSPGGTGIAALLWQTPEHDNMARSCELVLVDIAGDRVERRWMLPAGWAELVWSGDRIVALTGVEPGEAAGTCLVVLEPDGEELQPLTADLPACVISLAEAAPLVAVAEGLDSWLGRVEGDELVRVLDVDGSLDVVSANREGTVVAGVIKARGEPSDVWAGEPGTPWRRVSDLNPELRKHEWSTRERLSWNGADGLELDGLLLFPPGADRDDGPFSLVTLVHGGPYGRFADELQLSWMTPGELLASQGYACFLPNPRGGLGHGSTFARVVAGAVGVDDWRDILAGIEVLIADGVADPDRLAIGGWSQGGFMSAWAVGQTERFKAAVMGAGISDWGMMVAESDSPTFEGWLGGSAGWEEPGPHRHDELSPISYAARVRTPTLILHGEEDERVPVSQGRFFARALRHYGVPFELVTYPREPHVLAERNHLLDVLARWSEWLARWLGEPAVGS